MRISVATRILLGFVVVILAFGTAFAVTIQRLRTLGERLSLINSGYLRLSLTLNELETLQSNLVSYWDKAVDESGEGSGRTLIAASRLARLRSLNRADEFARDARAFANDPDEREFLIRLHGDFGALTASFAAMEKTYAVPGVVSQSGGSSSSWSWTHVVAALARGRLRADEHAAYEKIREIAFDLRRRVIRAGTIAQSDEEQAVRSAILAAALAVLVAAGATLLAHATVRPLGQLRDGARALGRGEWQKRVPEIGADELRGLAREFNAMAAALEEREQRIIRSERLATIGQLAAQITHEIRNPLAAIGLNAEILEEELRARGPASSDAQQAMSAIQSEVDRLTAVTEEYLQMARMPKPRLELAEMAELVRDDVAFLRDSWAARGVSISTAIDTSVGRSMVDDNQVRQALRNLIRNAGEAVLTQTRREVVVHVRKHENFIDIAVEDSGPGVPDDVKKRVFEPFFTTKEQGTGLGLAVTQQIMTEHGGSILVESAAGGGALVTLRFLRA